VKILQNAGSQEDHQEEDRQEGPAEEEGNYIIS